jgi:hypothetical protein
MYSLRRSDDGLLEGPINKKVYASYAPKRHAVAIARRDADKRGFSRKSKRLVQIVTDGDKDLQSYIEDFFPKAIHTIDVFHVVEYLWDAASCLYKEGSDELVDWVAGSVQEITHGRPYQSNGNANRRAGNRQNAFCEAAPPPQQPL